MRKIKDIIEILELDSSAWILRPTTSKDITECQKDLLKLSLEPLPQGYKDFLKKHNGLAWNGISFYGTDQVVEADNPSR